MSDPPGLDQITLVVRDVDASVRFYERLGLAIEPGPAEWSQDHVTLRSRGLVIDLDSVEFTKLWDKGWRATAAGGVVLGFRLASRPAVDELYADLTGAGYRAQQPPYDAFWGPRYAVVEDPDGNAIGLSSPVDGAQRSAPPQPPHRLFR